MFYRFIFDVVFFLRRIKMKGVSVFGFVFDFGVLFLLLFVSGENVSWCYSNVYFVFYVRGIRSVGCLRDFFLCFELWFVFI